MTESHRAEVSHRPSRFRAWILVTGVAMMTGLLVGCTVGRNYERPVRPPSASYMINGASEHRSRSTNSADGDQNSSNVKGVSSPWWAELGSARLNALVDQALQSSPTLAAAEATLRQARQTYVAHAGAAQSPQMNAGLGVQRQRASGATPDAPSGDRLFSLYQASVEVSYTFDLFGANRRFLESLAADIDYKRYQFEGARLTLVGNVVASAIAQAKLASVLQASEAILADQEAQLAIWRQRLAFGATSQGEVLDLQTQVELTRAGIPSLVAALEQNRHLLTILVGQAPGSDAIGAPFQLSEFTSPLRNPVLVRSELAQQRPDIQASEALLRAANARYGMAVAKFYPQITLGGSLGSQSLTMGSLFGGGSQIWGLAGQLTQPLFRRGLKAEAQAADAGFDAAAANYRQTVLQALRDVADVLQALEADAQSLRAQDTAHAAAQGHLHSIRQRHTLGATSYLEVLAAQQLAHQVQLGRATARAQHLLDTVALFQALGGGFPSDGVAIAAR